MKGSRPKYILATERDIAVAFKKFKAADLLDLFQRLIKERDTALELVRRGIAESINSDRFEKLTDELAELKLRYLMDEIE